MAREKYREILIEEAQLYGGSHTLKMWVQDTKAGFIVYDCINKKRKEFDNFADAKTHFKKL